MSPILMVLVTLIYVAVAFGEMARGNYPMALVFVGYSIANVGLIVALS